MQSREFDAASLEELVVAAGYTIRDIGPGNGWYALLPGETSFRHDGDDQNHIGFFSSKEDLLDEVGLDLVIGDTLIHHHLDETAWSFMNQGIRLELVREAFDKGGRKPGVGRKSGI